MPISRLLVVSVVLAVAAGAAGQDKQRLVELQIRYLGHLQRAELHLEAAEPDAALAELDRALACNVPDSHMPFLKLNTTGATAHYLRACALSAKNETAAAMKSLSAAAANGFRNTALVKSDPRLAEVRRLAAFAEIVAQFPSHDLTDRFAGKMVADREFGISLQRHRKGNFPKLGELAPDFELDLLGGGQEKLRLSAFRGQRPVVLVFGSFT